MYIFCRNSDNLYIFFCTVLNVIRTAEAIINDATIFILLLKRLHERDYKSNFCYCRFTLYRVHFLFNFLVCLWEVNLFYKSKRDLTVIK